MQLERIQLDDDRASKDDGTLPHPHSKRGGPENASTAASGTSASIDAYLDRVIGQVSAEEGLPKAEVESTLKNSFAAPKGPPKAVTEDEMRCEPGFAH